MLNSLQKIRYKLWFIIALTAIFPAIYSTVRIYFLNSLPDSWGLSIAAQVAWLHLAYEVLQESLLLPLYFIFGQVISKKAELRHRVTTAFGVTFSSYAVLTIIVLVFAEWMVTGMAQVSELRAATIEYIRFEAVAIMIGVLNEICLIVVIALASRKLILLLLGFKALLTIGFDSLFVGQFSFSLDVGVIGVAWTNIAVGITMLLPSLFVLQRLGVLGGEVYKPSEPWIGVWLRVAAQSGLESVARNLAFSLMILRLMNEVQEAGLFWVTNSFIWTWMLLPILTLGTLIRQDVGVNRGMIEQRFKGYLLLASGIVVLWVMSIPLWGWFVKTVMGSNEADRIVDLALVMLVFYVVFSFNHVLDSYLYGLGRTDLMLYQSLFVSIAYYGSAFTAYLSGVFIPNLISVALLFGGGIVVDSVITIIQFRRVNYPVTN